MENLPKSRAEAKKAGYTHYFTGKPCKAGHLSVRNTNSSNCLACNKIALEKLRAKDPESVRIKYYEWAKDNADLKKKRAEYRAAKREHYLNLSKANYYKNKEKYAFLHKLWVSNNKEKRLRSAHKRRALKAAAAGFFTSNDILNIKILQKEKCACCARSLRDTGYHVDHIYPISLGGSNWPSNIQLLCPHCNTSKRDKIPELFYAERGFLL